MSLTLDASECGRVILTMAESDSNNIADVGLHAGIGIADNKLMIECELLCYISCKFGKLSNARLMSIICDFYASEEITNAKKILVTCVDKLGLDKWIKPVNRKNKENKSKTEVNDILDVFAFVDEGLAMNKLPKYVAANVDNLPSA